MNYCSKFLRLIPGLCFARALNVKVSWWAWELPQYLLAGAALDFVFCSFHDWYRHFCHRCVGFGSGREGPDSFLADKTSY